MFGISPVWWFGVPAGLALLLALTVPFAKSRRNVLRLAGASFICAILALGAAAFWSWYFHDWFEPGIVPSRGMEAWRRFWREFQLPLAIGAVEMILLWAVCRWRLRKLRSRSEARSDATAG